MEMKGAVLSPPMTHVQPVEDFFLCFVHAAVAAPLLPVGLQHCPGL